MELVIDNLKRIYTAGKNTPLSGSMQGALSITRNRSIYVSGGIIHGIYESGERFSGAERIDGSGLIAIPGFIDSHTHMLYGGNRSREFELRAGGMTYLDLLKSGNGILKTVRDTRASPEIDLFTETAARLESFMRNGVTAVEMKSGYGLEFESEKKMINTMEILEKAYDIKILKTLLPLHAMPPESNRREYLSESNNMLSRLKGTFDFTDAFCDSGAFDVEEVGEYFSHAQEEKIPLRLHADEIEDIGATELCDKFPIRSVDHLLKTKEKGMEAVRRSGAVATILPSTAFSLGEKYADGRKWIEYGVPVAIASDHSPLNPVTNMQFVGNLSIRFCHLTVEETLNAMTANAAYSLGVQRKKGAIEEKMDADIVFYRADELRDIFYLWDTLKPSMVIRGGKIVYSDKNMGFEN